MVTVAVVAVPRCAICAKTSLLPSTMASSNIAFEITVEKKEVERNVPMSIKKLVFSFKLIAKIHQLIDT